MGSVLPDIDQETINELITCIHEAIDAIEIELDLLAQEPDNQEALHRLFRHLHSIKGNFRMCLLDPFTAYVHEVEETISEIRNGNQRFSVLIKEACLFALDRLRHFMDLLQQYGEIEQEEMADIGHHFCAIAQSPPMQADNSALYLLEAFNCQLPESYVCSLNEGNSAPNLSEIQQLGLKLEALKANNHTHTAQLAGLAAAISAFIESPIDRQQLQAAIYLHDIDVELLDNPECPAEINLAPSDYLQQFDDWRYAADIVKQMNEYIDVRSTLVETQLLSLSRRFLELVNNSSNNQPSHKGSILQALKMINEEVGSCFSPDVVGALNKTVLTFHQQQELSINQLAA